MLLETRKSENSIFEYRGIPVAAFKGGGIPETAAEKNKPEAVSLRLL
jgi:hypothetical protein